MTDAEILDYYANLLIIQYNGLPKAVATIKATARMFIMDQLPLAVQGAFDLETAVGKQLDVLAKYVGANRSGYGVNGQPITLSDSDLRTLIKICIVKNSTGSSLADIQELLYSFFQGGILVFDLQNMQMSYTVHSGIATEQLVQILITGNYLPKPMGVELADVTYVTTEGELFGFGTYPLPAYNQSPFNNYDDYNEDYPWVTY